MFKPEERHIMIGISCCRHWQNNFIGLQSVYLPVNCGDDDREFLPAEIKKMFEQSQHQLIFLLLFFFIRHGHMLYIKMLDTGV